MGKLKAEEQRIEHPEMRALKRRLKYGPKMTKAECAEYLRRLLKGAD